jgi:hypothetical protein
MNCTSIKRKREEKRREKEGGKEGGKGEHVPLAQRTKKF